MSAMRGEVTRCRLVRNDGSEWTVTDFEIDEGVVWVDARLDAAPGNGGPPGESVLENEPLQSGDRVQWLKSDGSVIWAMRNPVDGGVHWNVESRSGRSGFLEEDFRESA